MINFELLKEEDIIGENKLSIFKKLPMHAEVTDFARYKRSEDYNYLPYYLDSYHDYKTDRDTLYPYRTYHYNLAKYVHYDNIYGCSDVYGHDSDYIGVRLKVNLSDIKDQIIKDTMKNAFYVDSVENGVKVVLALLYPQDYLKDEETKEELDILYKHGKLKPIKSIIVPGKLVGFVRITTTNVYEYQAEKFIYNNGKWIVLSPIEWYYDEEKEVLVSKKVVLSGLSIKNDVGYNDNFKNSEISKFLGEEFENDTKMSKEEQYSYIAPFKDYVSDPEQNKMLENLKNYEENMEKIENMKNYVGILRNFLEQMKETNISKRSIKDLEKHMNPFLDEVTDMTDRYSTLLYENKM